MNHPLAERLSFAHSLFGVDDDEIAGTPPPQPRRRIEIIRPELLPTEYIEELERIINEKTAEGRLLEIPGTRIIDG